VSFVALVSSEISEQCSNKVDRIAVGVLLTDNLAFRLAVDASPNGVIVSDEDGCILFVNQQAEAIFGYEPGELVGGTMNELIPDASFTGDAPGPHGLPLDRQTRTMKAARDLSGRRKDGSVVPVGVGFAVTEQDGARLVIASVVDLTERRDLQDQLHDSLVQRLAFEQLLANLGARFVNLPPGEVDAAIIDTQRQIAESLDLDRSALWVFPPEGGAICTHSWTRPGYPQVPPRLEGREVLPQLVPRLRAGEIIAFERLDEVAGPIDRESLSKYGTKSSVTVPMKTTGETLAALSFGALRVERSWPPGLIERFRLVALLFEQALARRRDQEHLTAALAEVKQLQDQLALENTELRGEVRALRAPRLVVAESAAARQVLEQIEPVAATTATVLLLGETGSGKEVFAQAIHELSPRHKRPMVRVNCGAIPSALIESELFGRERGAYTGALARQIGRFEAADGSTVFLDEIGDLPIEAQVKLLRVLQDKVIERLGSNQTIKVDVRIIAATNRDLEKAVAERTFREDLFYRLNVYPITIPPLRERPEDIPVLVWTFVDEFSKAFGKRIESISKDSLAALQRYGWPGNVRELRNVVERAVIVATGPRLTLEPPSPSASASPRSPAPTGRLTDVEAQHIRSVLDSAGWRVRGKNGAAERLGMKPTTLESRMAKLGIRRERRSGD